ncbi:DUF1904 domain-containing protein [Dendrosporobacter sp. 1207_IL3150]|uniref:DUF1904 domain-containing protein n=1 Tax=Dendrosporobacter sp. 1207_IL3150 TaxID=3084054 RepID=UPI002FDB262D
MPQLIIRGMEKNLIKKMSKQLVDELTTIIGCPRDYFTIEAVNSTFVYDGEEVSGSPIVQVNWFDRGQSVQDQAAAVIDRNIRALGHDQVEIYFITLSEEKYYENGQHY